jgi:very-short-patch-repair endonuclease
MKGTLKIAGNSVEQVLAHQCLADRLPPFEQEFRFHPARKYRLDLAFPTLKVGVEIDGGIFSRGAHGSISGILRDIDKHNLLVMCGWRVLRFTPTQVRQGEAIEMLKELLRAA